MLNNIELEQAIAATPGEKVTKEYIESRIETVKFLHLRDLPEYPDSTTTMCYIYLDNGFTTHGYSACVDPANFNREVGETISYKQAFDKLWPLFGFLLAEARYLRDIRDYGTDD
jgi:hypothetical protein